MPTGEMLSVVGLGIGTVFVGLIAIIILCKIVSACCKNSGEKSTAETVIVPATAPAVQQIENRQEIIAAVSAAIAEELGTDISALRILSFKKL